MARDDQFVLHRVLPANEFGDGDLVAVCLELQAAQHVGEVAAEFARVDRVPPQLCDRVAQCLLLVLAQHRGNLGLAAGHEHDGACALVQREADRVVGGGVAGVQRGDDVDAPGQAVRVDRFGHAEVLEAHARREPELVRQPARARHQLVARFDAVDAPARRVLLEEQVVQDETEVGLARAVVHQLQVGVLGQCFGQQRLDELVEVIDLLELAPAVLVELAVAGEDMELLEQLDGLLGADLGVLGGHGLEEKEEAGRMGRMYPDAGRVPSVVSARTSAQTLARARR